MRAWPWLPFLLIGLALEVVYFLALPVGALAEPRLALLGRTWPPAGAATEAALLVLGGAQQQPRVALALVVLLTALYLGALALVRPAGDGAGVRRLIAGFAALFAVTTLLQPSLLSSDAFTYLLDGRMQILHGLNPYETVRASLLQDPALQIQPEANRFLLQLPNPYGPLPVMLSGLAVLLGGTSLAGALLAWKLLAILLLGLSLLVADRIVARHWPEHRTRALLLLAWNPLLVLQLAGDAHNDVLVLLLTLLAADRILAGRPLPACGLLAAAVMTKPPALLLAGAYALFLGRHRPRVLASGLGVGAAVGVLLLLPYGTGTLLMFRSALEHSALYTNSFFLLLGYHAQSGLVAAGVAPGTASLVLEQGLRQALALLLVGSLSWGAWTAPSPAVLVARAGAAWYVACLLVTPYFWPWYLCAPLALLCLPPAAPLRASAVCFSCTALFLLFPTWVGGDDTEGTMARLAMVYAAPVALALGALLPRRRS